MPKPGMRKVYIFAGFIVLAAIAKLFLAPSEVPVIWKVPVTGLRGDELAVSPDGTIYELDWWGGAGLSAYDRQGRLKWTSPPSVYVDSVPVIGRDGTIYIRGALKPFSKSEIKGLVALNPDCSVKWIFPIKEIDANGSATSLAVGTNGTLYFRVGGDFHSPKTLYAVSAAGSELWHFNSEGNMTAPVVVFDEENVLFHSAGQSNASLYRLSTTGAAQGEPFQLQVGSSSLSVDWDGGIYLKGDDRRLSAVNADGTLRWRFSSPLLVSCTPTIGADRTLYFTEKKRTSDSFLVAVDHDGRERWKLDLGPHNTSSPSTIGSDGTLFVASSDPKITAVNSDGTVKWVFKPLRRYSIRRPGSWKEFKKLMSEDFGDGMNVHITAPTLTPDGRLYFCLGDPYKVLYCLNVGVGLATNSPWPMQGADVRLTRHVAPRVPASSENRK